MPEKIPKKFLPVLLYIFLLSACSYQGNPENDDGFQPDLPPPPAPASELFENYKPASIQAIRLPKGFERIPVEKNSFAEYLRNFPLQQGDNKVHLYNGSLKSNQQAQFAILDLDVGNQDLQQCADAIMRLRAEYLFQQKKYAEIHFNFTNGTKAEYKKYAEGYRPQINGNKVSWAQTAPADDSYQSFRKYLNIVFSYAGSSSLSQELTSVENIEDIRIGDIFIQGGFPGHAIIVVDVAKNPLTGQKIFMLAQSYMPAQEIHILNNFNNPALSPWYSTDFGATLKTPEWTFKQDQLKRF